MRSLHASALLAPLALVFVVGCSDSADGPGPAKDAATADDVANVDASDAAPDVAVDEGVDASAEACTPTVYDCPALFRVVAADAGLDAAVDPDAALPPEPGMVVDLEGGTVTLFLGSAAPPISAATATVSYVSTVDLSKCKSPAFGDVVLAAGAGKLSAALPTGLSVAPDDFVDWCGTLHLTDACGVTTDVPMFGAYLQDVAVGGVQCAGACGADQWKAVGSGICADCPLPETLACHDLPNPTFTGPDFEFAPGLNGPAFTATSLSFHYMTNDADPNCSGSFDVPLTVHGDGTITGTMPARPADLFSACRGTVTLATACSQSVDFDLVLYDNGTTLEWGTACSD